MRSNNASPLFKLLSNNKIVRKYNCDEKHKVAIIEVMSKNTDKPVAKLLHKVSLYSQATDGLNEEGLSSSLKHTVIVILK